MNQKNYFKRFQRASARYGLSVFYRVFSVLPFWIIRGIATILLAIGFSLILRQKKVARESLKIAFGKEKSKEEVESIMNQCFMNLGWNMVEMIYSLSHAQEVPRHITVEGQQYLDQALAKGRGVVAVTAHFGNFPLMMLYFAVQKYKTNAIIRPARDEKLEEFLLQKRKECGLNTVYAVPRHQCVTEAIKVLRNNEILFVPMDQNFGSSGGIYVDFFGQKAATATGPIVFASRTQAAIVPMFIVRQGRDTHKIIIEKPLELEKGSNDDEMMYKNISKLTNLIEQYIRRYPYEWGWMHRRWKTREYESKYLPNA